MILTVRLVTFYISRVSSLHPASKAELLQANKTKRNEVKLREIIVLSPAGLSTFSLAQKDKQYTMQPTNQRKVLNKFCSKSINFNKCNKFIAFENIKTGYGLNVLKEKPK